MAALPLVRLRLKYVELDVFVERFAPNVTRGGIFIASREPRPVGSEVRFEVLLTSGPPVLSGEGRVTWVKEFNAAEPQRPHGMGVQFTVIDPACRPVLDRLLRKREEGQRRAAAPAAAPVTPPAPARPTADPRVTVPLAAAGDVEEIGDTALRRLVDRARALSVRTDDVEELLKHEPADEPPATLSQALDELNRYLHRRSGSGLVRLPPEPGAGDRGKGGAGS